MDLRAAVEGQCDESLRCSAANRRSCRTGRSGSPVLRDGSLGCRLTGYAGGQRAGRMPAGSARPRRVPGTRPYGHCGASCGGGSADDFPPIRPRRYQERIRTPDDPGLRDDGGRRRRIRPADGGDRPRGLPKLLRSAPMYDRQRLLPQGGSERRDELPAHGRWPGLGWRDRSGHRHGLRRLSQLPHPASRGRQRLLGQPRRGR